MGTKQKPSEFDCYSRALPDEPVFILLARDPMAPPLVNQWAEFREQEVRAGRRPNSDMEMVYEAQECAVEMETWRAANDGRWRTEQPPNDAAAPDLLAACKAQHQAIDILLAWLARADPTFFPSQSGIPWDAIQLANTAMEKAEGRS